MEIRSTIHEILLKVLLHSSMMKKEEKEVNEEKEMKMKEKETENSPRRTSSVGNPSWKAFEGIPHGQTRDQTGPDCHTRPENLD